MPSLNCTKRPIGSGPMMPETSVKCHSCGGRGRVQDPDHKLGQKCESCCGSGVLIIGEGEDGRSGQRPGLPRGEINGKCPSCEGIGIVQCPQHGMSQKCEPCGGVGLIPHLQCDVHQCQRRVLPDRKICENHAFPAARPPETTGRRAAVLATRKKIAAETKVSESISDAPEEETTP